MKPDARFEGKRLRLARTYHGWTQAALASRLAVTPAFISQVESGVRSPGEMLAEAQAHELGFAPSFFFREVVDEFTEEECHFRRRATTPISVRSRMLTRGTLFGELVSALEDEVDFPDYSVPSVTIQSAHDIERAAERCRVQWGLGVDTPIESMVRVVEHAGVMVTKLELGSTKIDAFSRHGKRGVIVLANDKVSPARSRLDAAHELGHLVMHEETEPGTPDGEAQAFRFAGAFLMPRAAFAREFPRAPKIDWRALFVLKARWKVSLAAIVKRAFELALIDPGQYQRAYKYMHYRGWQKPGAEPVKIADEEPELIASAFEEGDQDAADIAARIGLNDLVFEQVSGVKVRRTVSPTPTPTPIVSLDSYRSASRRRG